MKNKLTAVMVKNTPSGLLGDGGGLRLEKNGDTGKWIYRYSHLGKRREMGLGQWPTVSLSDARKLRDSWATELAAGRDPIAIREDQRAAEVAERDKNDPTFEELTRIVFEARKATLRGEGKRGRWLSPLERHLFPALGRKRVSALTRHDFANALRPIWRNMHPTAEKAYQRSRLIFREGKFMGFECDPFEVEAASRILGEVRHVTKPIPSTPWQELPGLYSSLGNSIADECLRFMILTCVRADGCTGARFAEIKDGVWTVPKDRVKGIEGLVEDFRVPLSGEAQKVVERMAEISPTFLFSARLGRPITTNACEKRLNEMKEPGRPHGFRSSFRTWVQDTDACSWEVSETVLGHSIGNNVERSYARSDLLERRRIAMEAWASHVTGKRAAEVAPISGRRTGTE